MLGWVFIDHSVTGPTNKQKYDYTRYRSVVVCGGCVWENDKHRLW